MSDSTAGKMNLEGMLNLIHRGDCVTGMKGLPSGCVDLAFADPPFNIGYDYDVYDDRRERDHYLQWSREWIAAVHRVLKPTGTFWVAIGDEYAAELKLLSHAIGFHCRSWVVWYYTFGVNCKNKFSRSHAHLFHFVKDAKDFTYRSDVLEHRVPSARQLVYADNRANPFGRLPDDTWILRPQDLVDCFTPGEDTWYFPRVAGTFAERAGFHGCQMPEQLLGRIIKLCSNDDEVVLDPFAGSATTLAVAKKLGRRFLGFELSSEYAVRGTRRLDEVRCGDPLEGAPEPLISALPTSQGKVRTAEGRRVKTNGSIADIGGGSRRARAKVEFVRALSTDALFDKRLIEAFSRTNDGHSLDRVIADPDINRRFTDACRDAGLPGESRDWNWRLFNCRKAGKLVGIPTARRTEISWENCDEFLFASEIALAQMLDDGCESLDAILCDPEEAKRFDEIASKFAPEFSSLQYRWAALKLRKEAKFARARAKLLKRRNDPRLSKPIPVSKFDLDAISGQAGVYVVAGNPKDDALYVGGALNLRNRLEKQFREHLMKVWHRVASGRQLRVQFLRVEPNPPELLAYQSLLVGRHHPKLNYKELAYERQYRRRLRRCVSGVFSRPSRC
jgi:site-specific DNA-methyltransferase (adenine-specific)